MKNLEVRGWFNKEVTDPNHMEFTLRYGSLQGYFIFPYHKKINEQTLQICLRRTEYSGPMFSIDVGNLSEDSKYFSSLGWIDISTRNFIKSRTKNNYGSVDIRHPFGNYVFDCPWIKRPIIELVDNWGLYVSPEIRRQGVGTALITAARVVLNQARISTLIISSIADIDPHQPNGRFYRGTRGHVFNVQSDYKWYNLEKISIGNIALPTKESKIRPYRFE